MSTDDTIDDPTYNWAYALEEAAAGLMDEAEQTFRRIGTPVALRMAELIAVGSVPGRVARQIAAWEAAGMTTHFMMSDDEADGVAEANELPADLGADRPPSQGFYMTPGITLHIDHADLAAKFAEGAISASRYALTLLTRIRHNSAPEFDQVSDATILRMTAGLPAAVAAMADGCQLAGRVVACLGLAERDEDGDIVDQDTLAPHRISFPSDLLDLDLFYGDEQLLLEPHDDPEHPGRRFKAWMADADDLDDATGGPWFGYTPQAALIAAIDYLQAFAAVGVR